MKPDPDRRKNCLAIAGLLGVFIGIPIFLAWNFLLAPLMEWRAHYSGLIGKPEPQVVEILGKPNFQLSAAEVQEKGIDAPWREMKYVPVPDRPVHKGVLLYEDVDQRTGRHNGVYVFVGDDGRVEGIEIAGR